MRQYTLIIILYAAATLLGTQLQANIKILFTAALIQDNYEQRKKCYVQNLKLLKKYGSDVYVVESCVSRSTFLNKFCKHVCYTHSNDVLISKSANEAISMNIGMESFNFAPDDMIIKITGRYILKTDEFISLVKKNLDADIIARVWNDSDAYTGCFAIKAKHLRNFLTSYYFPMICVEKNQNHCMGSQCIEHALGQYISLMKNTLNIVYWPKLPEYMPEACGRN